MKKAMAIYYSKFGNTEKIAKALREGMRKGGLFVESASIENVDPARLVEYDLLAVGAPTHAFGIAEPMKDFLKKLQNVDLKGKKGFAFDTKMGGRLYGSAAGGIEKDLEHLGVVIVRSRASAQVRMVEGKVALDENAEREFELIGTEIAAKTG